MLRFIGDQAEAVLAAGDRDLERVLDTCMEEVDWLIGEGAR